MTYPTDPQLISYPVTVSSFEYMMKSKDLGAFIGTIGNMEWNPYLLPVIEALHTVLAGGQVSINVVQRGNPEIIRALNEMLAKAQRDANEINKKSGYYVTISG